MKKIKAILSLLAFVMLFSSCENDGGSSKINLLVGAVPDIQNTSTGESFINLVKLNNGNSLDIEVKVNKVTNSIASMDIVAFYQKGENTYSATLKTNLTVFPSTLKFDENDLINSFDILKSTDDFNIGDKLTISAVLTLKDGTIIKMFNDEGLPNFGQDIANSQQFKVSQTYLVSCPSDLGGTYSVVSSGTSTDPGVVTDNPVSNFPYTVTITDNGGGNYTISDAFGGIYIYWYDIYGLDFEVEGTFSDVCGTISGKFEEPFGTDVLYSGTVNPDGTLSIHWTNGYDDFGDSVLTKI